MKRMTGIFLALLLIFTAGSAPAFARTVSFTKIVPTITVVTQDGRAANIQADSLQILGYDEQGRLLLFADGEYLKADPAQFHDMIEASVLDALPSVTEYKTLGEYEQGSAVSALQQALKELGYLSIVPDGSMGEKTKQALTAFQIAVGLEANGQADAGVQMLLRSMTDEAIVVERITSFDVLRDRYSGNLEIMENSGLLLDYDEFSGSGFISDGEPIVFELSGQGDIDRAEVRLAFGFSVQDSEDGTVTIAPALSVDCLCFRRPILKEVTLKSGSARVSLPVSGLTVSLEGVRTDEHTILPLEDDAAALLAAAEDNGELKIRLEGTYRAFDLVIPEAKLEALSSVGRIAAEIGK